MSNTAILLEYRRLLSTTVQKIKHVALTLAVVCVLLSSADTK